MMQRKTQRILSALTVLLLLLSTWTGLEVGVRADESYTPTNGYIFEFDDSDENTAKVWGYAQFSPFLPQLIYGQEELVNGYSIIFGLYDTETQKPFECLYCTDMPVDTDTTNYRRINLEDSTWAAAHADQLRAIVTHTYPCLTVEALAEASGIEGLSRGEAITGSQLAIWKSAHGDNVEVTDFLKQTIRGNQVSSKIQDQLNQERTDYDAGDDTYKAGVKARIQALYEYLMALEPELAGKRVASESSFVSRSEEPVRQQQADGTWTVTVEATIDVDLEANKGDHLTLTAYLANGQYFTQTALQNGKQTCTLSISNVPAEAANGTVTLAIDGKQDVDGVFLFDAEGIRGASQSMIGAYAGLMSTHAETKAEPDRVLRVFKHDGNRNPLANISFDVYYVGSVEDYRDGKLNIGAKPTEADMAKYAVTTNLVATMTTDAKGNAALNFGTEDGVYLIKELPNDAVEQVTDPFFVSLPDYARLDENDKPTYEITAEPKNTVRDESVKIEKDVTEIGNKHDTFAVGETHTWIIRTSVPKTLATGKTYTITDTLDSRLTYLDFDRVALYLGETENEETTFTEVLELTRGTDYQVTVDTTAENLERLTVSLTRQGMRRIAAAAGEEFEQYELHTSFHAKINETAQMGVNLENQAHITFTNNIGNSYEADSDKPEVHTGGIRLRKTDAGNGQPLSGAEFAVYRKATQEEVAADQELGQLPTLKIGETDFKMVRMTFYDNETMTGEKVDLLTTDETGMGWIYGLAYGTYYLSEVKAPDGYHQLRQPVELIVDAASHTEARILSVQNVAGTELPETGGMGITLFKTAGFLLAGGAALLLVCRRKKQKYEN